MHYFNGVLVRPFSNLIDIFIIFNRFLNYIFLFEFFKSKTLVDKVKCITTQINSYLLLTNIYMLY